jgi:phospholipase/carboxylesterase
MSACLIARLLDTLDTLGVIAQRMHPPRLDALVATLGDRDAGLRSALADAVWSADLMQLRDPVERAVGSTLDACDGLRAAVGSADALRQTYRALRSVSRAQEALYPTAAALPSVSRFFLEPDRRDDQALLDRLAVGAARTDVRTGVMHAGNDTGERGGFSVYVPEDYDPARAHPLVMALHGGSGHGRLFLWNWVREARSRGVILIAPTAIGGTWSLMDPEVDSANISRVLEQTAQHWHVDRTRLLLSGMSDGGTFALLSGLDEASPFTHLAPVAASFHPMLLTMAEPRRVTGLPVYLVHGALNWMFPISIARTAQRALTAAGAKVTYSEIADLSHAYPREEGSAMFDWFLAPPVGS